MSKTLTFAPGWTQIINTSNEVDERNDLLSYISDTYKGLYGFRPRGDTSNMTIEDLREEFVRDYVFPMFRANTVYEGEYLLGTSIARPLIAKRLIDIARETGADAISHGATGKGNDQVRFELGAYALMPGVKIIAPWREWDLLSREKLLKYAEDAGIEIDMKHKKGGAPYSMDANLLHVSYEGKALEDPWAEPAESMFTRSVSPEAAPDQPTTVEIEFDTDNPGQWALHCHNAYHQEAGMMTTVSYLA